MEAPLDCTPFSLTKPWNSTSIEQDIFMTRHCIPSTEYIVGLTSMFIFITFHSYILVRKLIRSPEFVSQPGFPLVVHQLCAFSLHAVGLTLCLTNSCIWLVPLIEGIAWVFTTWYISILAIIILDGMNMQKKNGTINEEKKTRRCWKSMTLRHYIDTFIVTCLSAAASYFKYTNQRIPNVICWTLVFMSSTFLVLIYDIRILQLRSGSVLDILKVVIKNSSMKLQVGSGQSASSKITETRDNLLSMLKWVVIIAYAGVLGLFVIATWAFATINSDLGMAWSSPLIFMNHIGPLWFIYVASNRIFKLY